MLTPVALRFLPSARVEPSNVKLASSSSSPEVPAITTRLSVRSLTAAELATNPPAMFAPPFASMAPVIVVKPVNVVLPSTTKSVVTPTR